MRHAGLPSHLKAVALVATAEPRHVSLSPAESEFRHVWENTLRGQAGAPVLNGVDARKKDRLMQWCIAGGQAVEESADIEKCCLHFIAPRQASRQFAHPFQELRCISQHLVWEHRFLRMWRNELRPGCCYNGRVGKVLHAQLRPPSRRLTAAPESGDNMRHEIVGTHHQHD